MEATTLIESFRVDGKVAVVTGAGSGIGRASALALAGAGAAVVCADINEEGAAATALQIAAAGGTGEGVVLDVSDRDGEEDLDRILSVNLKGVFFGCQAAGRVMVTQAEGGSIINTSSAAADAPSPNIASYAICKAGVVQMTKSLAVEIGKLGVRVNAVAPGFVLTGMTGRYFIRPDGTVDEEMQEAVIGPMRRFTPLRKIGEPEDIAAAVLYLASDASRFMTGQVIRPNGGVAMV